jgi:hypothetical protein
VDLHPDNKEKTAFSMGQGLGSSCPENTTEWLGRRVYFGGSRDFAAPRMERHLWLQPHAQKLLGPVGILRCEELHTRSPLGIHQRTIKKSPDSSFSEQSEKRAEWTTWWTVRRSLGYQQDPG